MTNEQWLVYIWSIYPNGGFSVLVTLCLVFTIFALIPITLSYNFDSNDLNKNDFLWTKLGKLKWVIPGILSVLLFLASLVPSKEHFMYIVATPYIVDTGKSIIESLNDPTSKAFKINQIMDKGLDKVLQSIENIDEPKKEK